MANLFYLIGCAKEIIKYNTSVSVLFILYTCGVFASSLFGPATTILVIMGGISYSFNWKGTSTLFFFCFFFLTIHRSGAYVITFGLGIPILYVLVCIIFNIDMAKDNPKQKKKKTNIQVGGSLKCHV